jgi:hypothetical protein
VRSNPTKSRTVVVTALRGGFISLVPVILIQVLTEKMAVGSSLRRNRKIIQVNPSIQLQISRCGQALEVIIVSLYIDKADWLSPT